MDSLPQQMSSDERSQYLRTLGATFAMAPVVISVPIVEVHVSETWVWLWPLALPLPMILLFRGAALLLNARVGSFGPRWVAYGAVAAALLLVLAPESLRLAVVNFSIRPFWGAMTAVGTLVALAYIWASAAYWWRGRRSPNTSFERTHDR